MPPQHIPPLWQPVLDDIVEWAMPDGTSTSDVKLGSIHGQAGDDISANVPFAIWTALSVANPEMLVIHALPQSMASTVDNTRARWDTNVEKFGLATCTLATLLEVLKRNTIPPQASVQPAGWENFVLPTQVLVIIDVDNDVSVELALTLAAALTWCCGTAAAARRAASSQAEASQAEDSHETTLQQVSVRLLALSSQPLHPLVDDFFQDFGQVHGFTLPPLRVVNYNSVVNSNKPAMTALVETVQRLPADASHTVICLQSGAQAPEEWYIDEVDGDLEGLLDAAGQHRRILYLSHEEAKVGRFTGSDYMHLVIGNTRCRTIFDRQTSQPVRVNLWLTDSELARQREWVNFFDVDESNIYVYQEELARNLIPFHLPDASSGGMAAFMVSLVDFPLWEPGALLWASDATAKVDRDARMEVERQTHQRRLLTFEGPLALIRLDPTLEAPPRLIHGLLPMLKYNERLAHFMTSPSMTGRVALVKAQVAAALTVGFDKLVEYLNPRFDQVTAADRRGLTSDMCSLGVLWMLGALVEKALNVTETTKDVTVKQSNRLPLVDGSVDIVMRPAAYNMLMLWSALANAYSACGVAIAPVSLDKVEVDALDQDDRDNLYRDLIMAFSHQVAVCSLDEYGIVHMHDIASRKPLRYTPFVASMVDWNHINASSENGVFVGVYTSASRKSADSPVCVEDWTWIPGPIVQEWTARIRGSSLIALSGLYPIHANEGEC